MGPAQPGAGGTLPNPGPAISPTSNPPFPENPVNGFALADGAGTTRPPSTSSRTAAAPSAIRASGQFTVFDAPLPVDDAAPTASLTRQRPSAREKDSAV